jgi:fluoride exporter
MIVWVGVALLGGFGACARFLVDKTFAMRGFPRGTLVVNLSGAFLLGALSDSGASSDVYLLAGTATLGAYTTFSTWMFESQRATEEGRPRVALVNLAISLVLGLGAAALGRVVL